MSAPRTSTPTGPPTPAVTGAPVRRRSEPLRRTAAALLLAGLVLVLAAVPAAASTPTPSPAPGSRPVHTVPPWVFVTCGVLIIVVAVVGGLFVLRARRNLPPASGDTR